ncbi:MAG: ankyrin repeat domain-containing protein, partial [Treponema sp.]|nr:ankyrin repeat domain-containing protein [Treponema sp.]
TAVREIKEISEPVIEEKEIIEDTKEELAKIQESVSDEQKNKVTKISEPEIEENPVTEEIKTDIAVNTDPVIEEPEIYTSTKNEAAKISEPEIKETKEISVKTEAKNSKDFEEEPAEEPAIETKSFFEDEAVVEDISPEYEEPVISPSKPKLVLEPEITEPEIPEARTGNRIQKTYLSDFMVYDTFELPDEEDTDFEDDISDDLNFRDSKGATSLMLSVKDGNDWKIKALIKSGADINAKDKDGWTALMYAVRYQSNLSILNLLLDAKPDIKTENNYGLSALVIASNYSDNPEIIKKLLSYYSPSDKEVQKAFIQLISTPKLSEYSLVAKMRVFLDFGLPVNAYYQGKTPLMYVCKFSSSTKAVKLLLDNNAITSIRSTEGKTAFDYAIENKNLVHDDTFWSLNKK